MVAVEWRAGEGGPGRKYYALTDDGTRAWHAQATRWASFARLTTDLVTSTPAATDTHATTGPKPVRNGARP
ncbi:PadR family transcriptional regulator [Cellulomonas sp. ATA003]|uniref:PadR family transcriptional regulator n=1 Tax=Cellulomonas sp. ATA003 TaxID=3073064 RepID=UPI0037BFC398